MKKVIKNNQYLFIGTFILLLIININLLTKNIISSDILLNNYIYKGYSWEISLGRFGLYIIGLLKSYLSIPLIDLIISYILISIITYFLIELFEIKDKVNKIFVSLVICISPITSATLLFHYCSIGYLIAFLCSVLSIYFFYKKNRSIIPIILIIITLSMYQAYLSVITTLLVLYNIKLILNKKYKYKELIKYLILLIIGIISYFILMKLSLIVFHINMSNYSNADKIGINTILSIPNKLVSSYQLSYEFFFKDSILKNSYFHNYILYIILFIIMIISIIKEIIKKKIKTNHILLIISLIILLPIFLNSIIFVINDIKLQLLMSMSYIILPIFILSFDNKKIYKYILFIVLGLLLRNYLIEIESTYLSLEHTNKSYNTIIEKAISTNKNKKYMIIGNIDNSKDDIYKMNYGFISNDGIFWNEYNLKSLAFKRYVYYYFGINIEFVDIDTYNELNKIKFNDIITNKDDIIIINFDKV